LLLWGAGGVEDNGGAGDSGGNTCFFFFDGGPWRITCLRCCVSGSGDDNVSFYLLFFCDRVGAPDILVGVWLVLAAGILGGGGLFFRSPVLLLARQISCCSSSLSTMMADVLGRPFTRLRCLAVSPPLRSPPQAGGLAECLGRAALCVKIQGLCFQI